MIDKGKTAVVTAADRLRALSLARTEGDLLGSEEALVGDLGVSRSTVRQVARLLEREGFLRVKRGPNGGYFAARPDLRTIESTVGAYLQSQEFDPEDMTVIASALWIEVVRRAALRRSGQTDAVVRRLKDIVSALTPEASFTSVREVETDCRSAILALAGSAYIELIFSINIAFINRVFAARGDQDARPEHRHFVRAWRDAKLIELTAIGEGDAEVATLAARHVRTLWHARVWLHREPGR